MGNWIQTYTGLRVDPTNMRPQDIDILDIAHSLSLMNRFTGHTPLPYSVAQHSCLVADLLPPHLALWGLLHDAAEAYLADISRPVKQSILKSGVELIKDIEAHIMQAVCLHFGLPIVEPALVKMADNQALVAEAYSFFGHTENYKYWDHHYSNYGGKPSLVTPLPWDIAERHFMNKYRHLMNTQSFEKAVA